MIIVLTSALFEGEETDDLGLLAVFGEHHGRHKVRLKPSYVPRGETPFNSWLAKQSVRAQDQIRLVLEQGLKERDFVTPTGEPKVVVEPRTTPEWPDSFARGPAKLPLDMVRELVSRPLRLLLENGRNDWGFLSKIVPDSWKKRWEQAVRAGWIESAGGGITEIPNVVRQQIAKDDAHRLRTWVMFDSDGRIAGHRSDQAQEALDACAEWCVTHHLLERRAIENYIPKATLFEWARRRPNRESREVKTEQVKAFVAMAPPQQHHYNLKEGFKKDFESEAQLDEELKGSIAALYPAALRDPQGTLWSGIHKAVAQEVWGDDPNRNPYEIPEAVLKSADFEAERAKVFQSIFSML